jgi:hypothetical protein
MVMLYFLDYQKRLFERVYARCVDLTSGGDRVVVGRFDSLGLNVYFWADGYRSGSLGLAASRKLPSLAS